MLYLCQTVDLVVDEILKVIESFDVAFSDKLKCAPITVLPVYSFSDLGGAALPDDLTNLVSLLYALDTLESEHFHLFAVLLASHLPTTQLCHLIRHL